MRRTVFIALLLAGTLGHAGDLTDVRAALLYQWSQLDWRSNAAEYATFDGYLARVANRKEASDLVRMQAAVTRSLLDVWHDGILAPAGMPDEIAAAYAQLVADTTNTQTAPALVQLSVLRRLTDQARAAVARGRYLLAAIYMAHAQCYVAAFPPYHAIVDDQRAGIEWERLRGILERKRAADACAQHAAQAHRFYAPAPDFASSFPVLCLVQANANLTNGTIASIENSHFVRWVLGISSANAFDAVGCQVDRETIFTGAQLVAAPLPTTLAALLALLPEARLLDSFTCSEEHLPWFQGNNTSLPAFFLQSCRVYLTNCVTVSWRPACNPATILSNRVICATVTVAQVESLVHAYLSSNAWWLVPRP